MKKNTLVHCFSLPNSLEKEFFLVNIPLWIASFTSLSKKNDIVLYCDKETEDLVKELGFQYNEIISIGQKNRSVMMCLDAMKYFSDQKDMIYVDTDVISTKDFSTEQFDIITQGIEHNSGWNLRNIAEYRKKYIDLIEDYYYNPADNNLFAYNAGFLGFNDLDFKSLYVENWQKHIDANLKYNQFLQYDIVFGTHVEQVQLYSLIKSYDKNLSIVEVQSKKKEVVEYKDFFEIIKHDYFHPHGRYKYDERIKRDVLKYLSLYCGSNSISKVNSIANDLTINHIMKLS